MFKKDFKSVKTSYPLRRSEYKKFKEAIITRFGLSDEDGELLVPQCLLSAKFVTNTNGSGIAFFDRKGVPLWFQMGSDHIMYEELVPTVYTLWKRVFLPIVTTSQLVVDKLRGGADLMAPGVVSIQPAHNVALPLQENHLVCVRGYNGDQGLPPMAVGKMAITSDLVEKTDKGKAVITLHSYGDILWEKGGKGEPPKALAVVQPKESSAQVLVGESMGGTSQIRPDDDPVDTTDAKSGAGGTSSATQAAGSSSADMERIPPTAVDEVLRGALLLYLNLQGPNLSFPLSASSLYTDGILLFRSSSIVDPSLYTIKQSSHKKLKPMLKSFEKEGILKLKEISGELNVTDVNILHDAVQRARRYRTIVDNERKEKEKAREDELGSSVQQINIRESWKPQGSGLGLFNAVGASTSDQYSIPSLRDDVFSKYITQHSLTHPLERGYFVLDDLLKGILLNKEKEKNEEFMRRDEGLKRLVAACQPWYEIGVDGGKTESREGTLHPISISIKMRQGRKAVTLITNYEPFFLTADGMSEDLRRLCAAQTSVSPVNGKPNQCEVLVQGKQEKVISEYLRGKGVPKKWIQLEDTTEKKKGR